MSNTSGLSHPPSFKDSHSLNIGDYPRLHFLFLKQKIKQKQMKGEAFTTLSCYLAFRSVFITCLCFWQWSLPGETSSIAIRSSIAEDTLLGCSSFLSVFDNDGITCVYFREILYWQLWQDTESLRHSKLEKLCLCLKRRNWESLWRS